MFRALGEHLRRMPYPLYALLRRRCPMLRIPRLGHWALFDYENVHRALTDHDVCSSDLSLGGFGTLG